MKRLLVCLLLVGVVGCGGSVAGEAESLANELSGKLPVLDHELVEGPSVNVQETDSSVSPYRAMITFKVQADVFGEYTKGYMSQTGTFAYQDGTFVLKSVKVTTYDPERHSFELLGPKRDTYYDRYAEIWESLGK